MSTAPDRAPGLMARLRHLWTRGASPWVGLRDGPVVGPDGRTDVPGLRLAGDLADTPILKGAVQHGWRIGEALVAELAPTAPAEDQLDVVVVGAGPAGASAAMALHAAGRRVVVLERDTAFSTLATFPRGKMLYAEPRGLLVDAPLTFEDATKEAVVEDWRATLAASGVPVHEGVEVTRVGGAIDAFEIEAERDGTPRTLAARRVVVAIGRRGTPRTLGVPGEAQPHVHHALEDARRHAGKRVVVVGGGDSAAEAAVQLAEAGAQVTWSYRGGELRRPKPRNQQAATAAIERDALTFLGHTRVTGISGTTVHLEGSRGATDAPADTVFVLIGTTPPTAFLRQLGVPMASDRSTTRTLGVLAFAAFTWCFYVLKSGRDLFPFHGDGPLDWVPGALSVAAPWWPGDPGRILGAGFWGTLLYSLAILGFGLAAMRRHPTPIQQRRYASLIGFQWVFLFGIPELLAPMVTEVSGALYALSVPWPLRIDSLTYGPGALGWAAVGAFTSFVALPAFVVRHNERFCSWMCGCGGLAETVGDVWRWRSPRGDLARRAEGAGRLIFWLAVPVTLLVIADTWQLVGHQQWLDQDVTVAQGEARIQPSQVETRPGAIRIAEADVSDRTLVLQLEKLGDDGAWHADGWLNGVTVDGVTTYPDKVADGRYAYPLPAGAPVVVNAHAASSALSKPKDFARAWYGLMVDFLLASVLGVALYPLLGNRVWCRFFCPLRAYMEWIAARWGRLAIEADETCISCGECTKACQMGIDVQGFSEHQAVLDNAHSACIQCGICVEVCPMDTLSLIDRGRPSPSTPRPDGPRWGV